ncbi:hypothetical protein D4R89_13915 [bacterium]|nr:MAG: hypothetical protein D4R89_13915 [bacterium]
MDTNLKAQPIAVTADLPGANAENTPKSDWHAPIITRIDIKRTMKGSGVYSDGTAHTHIG